MICVNCIIVEDYRLQLGRKVRYSESKINCKVYYMSLLLQQFQMNLKRIVTKTILHCIKDGRIANLYAKEQ